jgi:hypothetical protein
MTNAIAPHDPEMTPVPGDLPPEPQIAVYGVEVPPDCTLVFAELNAPFVPGPDALRARHESGEPR